MTAALLIIDVQNDYFPGGALPLWNAEATLDAVVNAIDRARARGEAVVLVQHVAASANSPLFQPALPASASMRASWPLPPTRPSS